MASAKRTSKGKQAIFKELFDILDVEWNDKYVSDGGTVTGEGLNALLGEVSFRSGIPQTNLPDKEDRKIRLINKSQEACVLALEIGKRTSIPYSEESFFSIFVNAWELLLKAKILHDGGEIKLPNEQYKTITFGKSVKKVFPDDNNPIRKNLFELSYLRNSAAHSFIPIILPSMIPLLQAGIYNYREQILNWFGIDMKKRIPSESMIFVLDSDSQIETITRIKSKLSKNTIDYIKWWEDKIKVEINSLLESDIRQFFNPIELNSSSQSVLSKTDAESYFGYFN